MTAHNETPGRDSTSSYLCSKCGGTGVLPDPTDPTADYIFCPLGCPCPPKVEQTWVCPIDATHQLARRHVVAVLHRVRWNSGQPWCPTCDADAVLAPSHVGGQGNG